MSTRRPHLLPAVTVILLLVGGLTGGGIYARSVEDHYVNSIALIPLTQILSGSALQRAAFHQPDLLPVYGSSEIVNGGPPYRAEDFFVNYPTGFQVFVIAKSGMTTLDMAQDLAAIGPDLRGKKVVVSFTPLMFTLKEVGEKGYAANFSLLHANELAFSPSLSLSLKQHAARRMLDYPSTLEKDALLKFALQNLAGGSAGNDLIYYLTFPLGSLNTLVIRMQDHWEVVKYFWRHSFFEKDAIKPAAIDWQVEIAQAGREQEKYAASNPYGLQDNYWNKMKDSFKVMPPGSADKKFIQELQTSKEWDDLNILLAVLHQMGAQTMVVSRPINGALYEANGVSNQARWFYYNRLEQTVNPYHLPLVEFKDHDTDRLFNVDEWSHPSRLGWIYVDQALDAFFHNRLP